MMQLRKEGTLGCCLAILGLAFLLLSPNGTQAQVGSAALSGIVQDTTGAVVPGAAATLTNQVNGERRSTTSSGDGIFTFSAVPSAFHATARICDRAFAFHPGTRSKSK